METTVGLKKTRASTWFIEAAIFVGALLLYGLLSSNNSNYADDALHWGYLITQSSGLINSHHLYLNAMRELYHALGSAFGAAVDPVWLLAAYAALWGAIGLVSLYRLLRLLGCGPAALPGTLVCAFATDYWAYSTVSDVYIPATALLVVGAYAFLRSLRAESAYQQTAWVSGAVLAFVLMTLHHQAYSIFVAGIAVGALLMREGLRARRLKQSAIVLVVTGLTSLAFYGVVYKTIPNPEGKSFRAFISGYVESFDARPDQKLISFSILVNSGAGELRALFPYYVVYRSDSVTRAIQRRFPYRNVYPYPYLVRSLSPVSVALILLGAVTAGLLGAALVARGIAAAVRERDGTLALLFAMLPTALFFIWWEGISDEFWIWSIPLVAVLVAKGAATGTRWSIRFMSAVVVGLFVSSLLGAILLFADPNNDIDAVNRRYLASVGSTDLLVGFDEIQSTARARLAMQWQGFRYFNIFSHSSSWTSADLAALDREIAETLARGGMICVDSYVPHPPKSYLACISLMNREFETQRKDILDHLKAVPPARIKWMPQVATVPGYFVE